MVNEPVPIDEGKNDWVDEMDVVPLKTTLKFAPVVGTKLNVPAVIVIVAPLPITTFAGFALVIDPAVSTRAVPDVPKLNFAEPEVPQSTTALA
jgi:hypothetical protein